jgi:hypothetical protein
MAVSWDKGPLPLSETKRATILGVSVRVFRPIWAAISEKWVEIDAGFINLRLEQQRADLVDYSDHQRQRGIAGARKRWADKSHSERYDECMANAIKNACPDDGSPISNLQKDQEPYQEQKPARARTTALEPAWRQRISGSSLINGADRRRHATAHAWCCDRGLCVTHGQHGQFKARLVGPDEEREARLRAFYTATVTALGDLEVGDTLFAFWDHAFAAWIGTVTSAPGRSESAAAHTLRAARAVLGEP